MLSYRSKQNLRYVHHRLRTLAQDLSEHHDFVIHTGHRDREEQGEAHERGESVFMWPRSPHNKLPALAIDFLPGDFDGDWTKVSPFAKIANAFIVEAPRRGFAVYWHQEFPEHIEIAPTWSMPGFGFTDTG